MAAFTLSLDAAITKASEAHASASISILQTAFSSLQEALKAGGYELPAPPAPPPAPAPAPAPPKPGAATPAKAPASSRAAPPSRTGVPSRTAAPAKPATKAAAAPAARATAAKSATVPARGSPAAKPGAAAAGAKGPAAAAKPAAAPAPPKAAGTFMETKLEASAAKPGALVSLSLSFKPSLELPAKSTITLALPSFTVPAEPTLPIKSTAGLSAAAVAEPPSVVLTVAENAKLEAGALVTISFSDPPVIATPEKGISAEQAQLLTLSGASNAASFAPAPLETAPRIRASQLPQKQQLALIQLGWLLFESGPVGWERGDHSKVATKVFRDVFVDTKEVEGREKEAFQAALGLMSCHASASLVLDRCLNRLVPALPEKAEEGKEGEKKEGEGKEGEKKEGEDGGGGKQEREREEQLVKEAENMIKDIKAEELTKEDKIALARLYAAREAFDKALPLLEGAGLEMARAQTLERQYLSVLNRTPELPRLEPLLAEVSRAYEAAAEKGAGEAVLRACLGAAMAAEERAVVQEVYGGAAGGGGQEAGQDQAATDSANMDEINAILKNRGVFGKPTVEEQIKELEEEYHDNVNFGLHAQADIVAALLEWFRAYRTRQERGGEVYSKKEQAKEELVGKKELEAALAFYKKAVIAGYCLLPTHAACEARY